MSYMVSRFLLYYPCALTAHEGTITKTFRILVPTDFSDSALLALEHGIFLARKFESELVLLHVAELLTITFHDFP